jgi:hypothetical protein
MMKLTLPRPPGRCLPGRAAVRQWPGWADRRRSPGRRTSADATIAAATITGSGRGSRPGRRARPCVCGRCRR